MLKVKPRALRIANLQLLVSIFSAENRYRRQEDGFCSESNSNGIR
jgi:hypothetical protein